MKIKRIISIFLIAIMVLCSTSLTAFAAETVDNTDTKIEVIPLEVVSVTFEPTSTRESMVALGSATSGNFYHSATVTVNIPSSIISYSANQVGIIIVDRTDGSTGDHFTVECINKPLHNTQEYVVGSTSWTFYNLVGIEASGGDSLSFRAEWVSGNNLSHQFEFMAALVYNG